MVQTIFAQAAWLRPCSDAALASLQKLLLRKFLQSRLRRNRTQRGVLCKDW